jgi:Ribonuclease G/E
VPDWVWQILLKRLQRGKISVDVCYYFLQKHRLWKIRAIGSVKARPESLKYYSSAWVFKEEKLDNKVSKDLVRKMYLFSGKQIILWRSTTYIDVLINLGSRTDLEDLFFLITGCFETYILQVL